MKLKGYEVVYYYNGHRLSAGNKQIFPLREIAEVYKKNYESYPWLHHELYIEEVDYEGEPLKEYKMYKGKKVIDESHYFGLHACEIGDYFDDEMIDYFMDILPPACMKAGFIQIGEPVTIRVDESIKKGRNTYDTFKRPDKDRMDIWMYCGDCFKGEDVKRGRELQYV